MADLPPLTHHEILERAAPLVRRGRAVDLAASDRAERRIAFRPVDHPAAGALPALRETLVLDCGDGAALKLVRRLEVEPGLAAVLDAEGDDPAALLDAVEAVGAPEQVAAGPRRLLVFDERLAGGVRTLRAAAGRCGALRVSARVSPVAGYPAELKLQRIAGDPCAPATLPDDLLAVLGRPWSLMTEVAGVWQASVGLRGREPQRSAMARARLAHTAEHLATTLAEPPLRFHQRHRAARWGVSLRRLVPLSVGLAVVGAGLAAQRAGGEWNAALAILANIAPPLLMGLFFLRREMPRIELPRIPLPPRASAWRTEA